MFGAGTASVVCPINRILYQDEVQLGWVAVYCCDQQVCVCIVYYVAQLRLNGAHYLP